MAELKTKPNNFILERNTTKREVKTNPKDRIEIEVGDSKQDDFKPQLKIQRWDNEVNFSIRAEEDPTAIVETDGDVIKYKAKEYEVHLYEKNDVAEDGGFEFEWELLKKPRSNVLSTTIMSKGLDFFYQPPLTEEEIANGAKRPENIVGSYAVYHKTRRDNYVGGKEYKTGKAFHIYRPKAIDANGKETWCKLNITKTNLAVTVPQKFLDEAVYPVVVDPTFGYETIGGSASTNDASQDVFGSFFTLTERGEITKITAHIAGWSGFRAGPYLKTGAVAGDLVSNGQSDSTSLATSTKAWVDFTFPTNPIIDADDYWLVATGLESKFSYDSSTAKGFNKDISNFDNPPDLPASFSYTASDFLISIYATYTEAPATGSTSNFLAFM